MGFWRHAMKLSLLLDLGLPLNQWARSISPESVEIDKIQLFSVFAYTEYGNRFQFSEFDLFNSEAGISNSISIIGLSPERFL